MDFLKKGQDLVGGANNSTSGQNQQPAQQGGAAPQQQGQNTNAAGGEDYGDKGLDFLEKKMGYNQSRETNEKISDGARGLYEKASGSKVDSKYSN